MSWPEGREAGPSGRFQRLVMPIGREAGGTSGRRQGKGLPPQRGGRCHRPCLWIRGARARGGGGGRVCPSSSTKRTTRPLMTDSYRRVWWPWRWKRNAAMDPPSPDPWIAAAVLQQHQPKNRRGHSTRDLGGHSTRDLGGHRAMQLLIPDGRAGVVVPGGRLLVLVLGGRPMVLVLGGRLLVLVCRMQSSLIRGRGTGRKRNSEECVRILVRQAAKEGRFNASEQKRLRKIRPHPTTRQYRQADAALIKNGGEGKWDPFRPLKN